MERRLKIGLSNSQEVHGLGLSGQFRFFPLTLAAYGLVCAAPTGTLHYTNLLERETDYDKNRN